MQTARGFASDCFWLWCALLNHAQFHRFTGTLSSSSSATSCCQLRIVWTCSKHLTTNAISSFESRVNRTEEQKGTAKSCCVQYAKNPHPNPIEPRFLMGVVCTQRFANSKLPTPLKIIKKISCYKLRLGFGSSADHARVVTNDFYCIVVYCSLNSLKHPV